MVYEYPKTKPNIHHDDDMPIWGTYDPLANVEEEDDKRGGDEL